MGFGIGLSLTPMNLAAMNAVSRDHAGAAAGILVTLSGLGATLGVAVTGAIFQELQTERTVTLVGNQGVEIERGQAQTLDGLLAGAPGAQRSLDRIAGSDAKGAEEAVREAFVSALGTSLKLSAALGPVGALLALILLRRSSPVDAARVEYPVSSATARPAPAEPSSPNRSLRPDAVSAPGRPKRAAVRWRSVEMNCSALGRC